jgi:hypothetical protein
MAEDRGPLPSRYESAVRKMWFIMDMLDNARRIDCIHTQKIISDLDLCFMMCFIVKLDMRFSDPVGTNRHHELKKTFLAQRELLRLWQALKRNGLSTKHDMLRMWVAIKYTPPPKEEGLPMFGVPRDKVGKMMMEY